jgi:lysophospholipase L1-like esterase
VTGAGFSRFVAIGDSTTEGLEDPYPDGGYRGWADRLAERLALANPRLGYANLAIRGRKVGQIRAEQLQPALALRPDLASVIAGLNDILRPRVDLARVTADFEEMVEALRGAGATVLMMTYPDPTRVIAVAGSPVRRRVTAFNHTLREIAQRHEAVLIDLDRDGVSDPRLWSEDRLHANDLGHERIAAGAAEALGLADVGEDRGWTKPLPELVRPPLARRIADEAAWTGRHLAPWITRRIRGRSSGDGREPKRPALEPVEGPIEPAAGPIDRGFGAPGA